MKELCVRPRLPTICNRPFHHELIQLTPKSILHPPGADVRKRIDVSELLVHPGAKSDKSLDSLTHPNPPP